MRSLARACLRLLMLAIPVVIAACYGPLARFSRQGKVIDRQTHAPIENVEVDCILADGTLEGSAWTGPDGSFDLWYDRTCDHLIARATDAYQEATIPYAEGSGTVTIQMDPK